MSAATIRQEIHDWAKAQGRHYHNSDLDLFVGKMEYTDIVLPSGQVEYVDTIHEVGDGESMTVFSVGDTDYGIRGTYTSWGSDWDSGPYEVQKREVTIERWETL